MVVLVRVRDRFRELCSELEDDERHDKPDQEYGDASNGYCAACDVLADPWKAEHNRLDDHQYDDARDQTYERWHDWSKRSPRAVRAALRIGHIFFTVRATYEALSDIALLKPALPDSSNSLLHPPFTTR